MSNCYRCGDGVKNGSEQCDGTDTGGATCVSLNEGFIGCTLGCTETCTYDRSACYQCASCRDCNNQACIGGKCGSCTQNSDCCAPLVCFLGTCRLF